MTDERERIEAWLRERIARRLRLESHAVDAERTFDSYGLGSIDAVELSGELEEHLGRELDPTLVYEHPTIRAVARALSGAPEPEVTAPPRRSATDVPIAVVGMACRFPGGADTVDALWDLLVSGRDAGRTVPADRWDADAYLDPDPAAPGKAYTQSGGFVGDVAGFDAELFGMSHAEALRMDPQQRMLLELAWAALEDAGVAADSLRGSRTGVFVGLMESIQYTQVQLEAAGADLLDDPFFAMGAAASVAAGRIAYLLDLRGPAVALDTACSSSLVCTHLAVQSLRRGECELALVGGASLIAHPQSMVQACKMGMLARDGRVKAFDAAADGFLLAEGAGVVALERLDDARHHGHPIHAVIEGSAVNQDGRSNGITAPSRAAQVAVIRAALADGDVEPHALDYVEAHGSGTALGDAIEVGALKSVFRDRPDALPPLSIGSVKTNLGHLQAAAGMAGLIKAALMVERGAIARTLHLSELNPALKLDGTRISPAVEHAPWPPSMRARRAGVSSFGWSGTNAHVVLQAPPRQPRRRASDDDPQALPLSAASDAALADVARALRARLTQDPAPRLQDVALTLGAGRAALGVRRALVCRDTAEAVRRLEQVDGGEPRGDAPELGFLLSGSQRAGAKRLAEREPAFREALERVDRVVAGRGAAVFALDYATAALLQSWGVRPAAVRGVGAGLCAAAAIAGVLTLEDAVSVALEREKLVGCSDREIRLAEFVASLSCRTPSLPIATGAGAWLSEAQAAEPMFWASELFSTARAAADGPIATATDVLVAIGDGSPAQSDGVLQTGGDRESLLRVAARLWEGGAAIRWDAVLDGRDARRVRLPAYPFRHTRYWPQGSRPDTGRADGKHPDLASWCYVPAWRESVAGQRRELPAGPWLILADGGAARETADRLRGLGALVTVVARGDELAVNVGGGCVVDPREGDHLTELLERLRAADAWPSHVVHAWAATPTGAAEDVTAGFGSLMLLAQAIARTARDADIELLAATTAAACVLGTEATVPERAMVAALLRCVGAEQPNLRCRCVDVEADGRGAAQLLAELALDPAGADVAWRGRRRWTRGHEPVRIERASSPVWRHRGVYLITGGLGGLGLVLAGQLARSVQARLVLVGRSALPERAAWERRLAELPAEDPLARRLRAVLDLERAGAEVLALEADVADRDALRSAVRQAKRRFGALHGVVHAAGVPGAGLLLRKTREDAEAVLRPKVLGTVNLASALVDEPLDFVALYSSAAATLGGFGESDYAAANAFMDAWARAGSRPGTRVVSIAWGAWRRDTWQERVFEGMPELASRVRRYRDDLGIEDDEGTELLTRILAAEHANVLVLPQDPATTKAAIAAVADVDALVSASPRRQLFPRPDLRVAYKPPRSDTERQLAAIWSEQLGVDRVGVDDPFFELGGSSLIGLSILARVEAELGKAVPPATLFERPTVGELGAFLAGGEREATDRLVEHGARGERRRQRAMAARRRSPAT